MSGSCQKIKLRTWPRRDIFSFFSALDQPFYSVCFRVDVTQLHTYTKTHGLSFYYVMTYLVTQAVNEVENLRYTIRDETVVLLSHKKADSYIHIDVEFGEGEGKIPVDSIAKRAEAYKPKEKVTYKMIKEYIEAKYGFKVHTAYIAEVKRDLGLPMYDAPNAVEELKQPKKHPTPEKVEAIKDALRYFAVI